MRKYYETIREEIYQETLDNGLKVTINLKKGFKKTMVLFGTNFGSLFNKFQVGEEIVEIPQGVAHFLEHKLFANEDGSDATTDFSALGLEVNAFTDYNQTVYLFSGTENIETGIEMLLDFVQSPFFSEESVEAEKGIIAQELNMYLDNPSDRLYRGLLSNMFFDYPIKYDVGGTIEEIQKIDKDLLYKCYNLFYHPGNMEFLVIGDVDVSKIMELIKDNQNKKTFKEFVKPVRIFEKEEQIVKEVHSDIKMEVVIPKARIGLKLPFYDAKENEPIVNEMLIKMILEYTFGANTAFYQGLIDEEIVSGGLGYNVFVDNVCGFITISADTKKPEVFIKKVSKKLKSLQNITMCKNSFNRLRKAMLGSCIKAFNNIEFIGYNFFDYNLKNCDLLASIDYMKDKTIDDLKSMGTLFKEEAICSFVIYPNKKQ